MPEIRASRCAGLSSCSALEFFRWNQSFGNLHFYSWHYMISEINRCQRKIFNCRGERWVVQALQRWKWEGHIKRVVQQRNDTPFLHVSTICALFLYNILLAHRYKWCTKMMHKQMDLSAYKQCTPLGQHIQCALSLYIQTSTPWLDILVCNLSPTTNWQLFSYMLY